MPKILLLGGPDVDARIPLILLLKDHFQFVVIGSDPCKSDVFEKFQIEYAHYSLNRGSNPFSDLKTFWQLIHLIQKIKPDVIHTFDTKPCVWGRIAAWLNHVPAIVGTLPGLGSLYSQDDLRSRLIRAVYNPLQAFSSRCSTLTIFQNAEDREQMIRLGIVPYHKTTLLAGSGVETEVFNPEQFSLEEKHLARVSLGLGDDQIVITMISRLIRQKGVLEFARSAKLVRERYPKAEFLLIGPDDQESVNSLTHAERQEVIGSTNWLGIRSDIPRLLAISDIFVLPTYYREGIPRVLLEAASMGLPLVAANVPGCTEVIEDRVNGFLPPAKNERALALSIESLIVDPSLRKKFGEASRRRAVAHFDLSIIAYQTSEIYRTINEIPKGI